jgi:hypothetical protein
VGHWLPDRPVNQKHYNQSKVVSGSEVWLTVGSGDQISGARGGRRGSLVGCNGGAAGHSRAQASSNFGGSSKLGAGEEALCKWYQT